MAGLGTPRLGLNSGLYLDSATAERRVRSGDLAASGFSVSFEDEAMQKPDAGQAAAAASVMETPAPKAERSTLGRLGAAPGYEVVFDQKAVEQPEPASKQVADEDYGFQPANALKKGFKGLGLTWDFLANRLEKAVTGDTKDTAPILAKSVDEYNQIASDPRIGKMVKEADQKYTDEGVVAATGSMLSWMVRNPTMVANFITEQIPGAAIGGGIGGVATAPVRGAVVGAVARAGASKGVQKAVEAGALGASINSSAVVFQSLGTNYTEGLQKFEGDTEAAADYAVTKTAAEVPANAVAGAFLGINPFKSKIANILNQTNIQGIGGATGAYMASKAVGEDPSFGELALEYLGEAVTAPGEVASAGIEKFRGKPQEQGPQAPPNPISDRNAGDPSNTPGLAPAQMQEFVNDSRSVPFFAALYQTADDATKTQIEQAMGRSDQLEAFQTAINNVQSIEDGNRLVQQNGDFANLVLGSLDPFLSTPPPAGVYKTTPPSLARAASEDASFGSDENLASLEEEIQRARAVREFEREQPGGLVPSQASGIDASASQSDTSQGVVVEPPLKEGFIRVYHSGSRGEGETGRWVSTNREYAANYRPDLPLFFLDVPEADPRVNNPDYADQGVGQGFTFNFELTPQEAALLEPAAAPRQLESQTTANVNQATEAEQAAQEGAAEQPVADTAVPAATAPTEPAAAAVGGVSSPEAAEASQAAASPTVSTDSFSQLQTSLEQRGAEAGSVKRVKNPAHLNKIAKLFGVEVFAYSYNGSDARLKKLAGTNVPSASGKSIIGINVTQSPKASLFVLGHEVFHDLARRFPQQAQSLSLEIKSYLQANRYQDYKKFYESKNQAEKTDEEVAADVLGTLFTDKKFWEQLGVRNQSLLARVLSVIDNLIASFKANADSGRMQIKEFITEYEKVRDMVASFVTETQQGKPSQPQAGTAADEMADLPIDRVRQLLAEKRISDAAKLFKASNLQAQGFDFTQLARESGARVIGRSVVKSQPAEAQAQIGSTSASDSVRTEGATQPAATAPTKSAKPEIAGWKAVIDNEDADRTTRLSQETYATKEEAEAAGDFAPRAVDANGKPIQVKANPRDVKNMSGRATVVKDEEQDSEPPRSRRAQAPSREPTAENVIRSRVRRLMTAADSTSEDRAKLEEEAKKAKASAPNEVSNVDDVEDPNRFADTIGEREDDAIGRAEGEMSASKRISDGVIDQQRKLLKRRAKEVAENPDVMMGELLNIKSDAQAAGLSPEVIADIFDTPMAQIKALADGLMSEVKADEQLTDVTDETNVEQQPAEVGDPITTIGAARNAVQTIKEGLSGGKMTIDGIVRVLQLARKDANFSIGELVYVMEDEGIEIPSVFDRLNGRPFMTPFVDYVSSSANHPVARQEWFTSLDRALNQSSTQERNFINGTLLTAAERDLYADWKAKNTRAPVDVDSKDVRQVFPNSLFTKFSLTQMRNPESIPQGQLPLSVRSGIVDFVQDWYADVSNALTYRPDMARQILGALAPQDLKAFTAWRKAQQRAVAKKAEVIGRSVDYGNLMGLRFVGPMLTDAYKQQLALADQFMAKEAMAWAARIDALIERVNQDQSLSPQERKQAIRDITHTELIRIHKTIRNRARKLENITERDDSFANWVAEMNERMSRPEQQQGRTDDGGFVAIEEQASEESFDDMAARLGDALFRIGNGETGSVASTVLVQSQVSEILGTFKSAANVKVMGNPSHLPDGVRERLMKRLTNGYVPKGLYDAQTGNIYIFSEAATSEYDTQFTLFHELYGHFGLRAFLGDTYTDYFNSLYNGNKAIREAANKQKEGRNISNAVAVEEALSDMAGEGKYAGVIKGVIGKLIKSLRDGGFEAVANWLSKYTNAEVMYVLRAARDAARNGGVPVLNGAPADVLLSEVRMPYEMYSTRDGETTAYARYNPVTMQWYVFTPKQGSTNINTDYQSTTMPHDRFDDVLAEMKRNGKTMRRMRSGLFVDNRLPTDNVQIQDPRDVGGWFKRAMYWAAIRAQNEYLPIFKVVQQLEKAGRMADFMNPMKALKLLERKTAARLEKQVEQKFVEPITALLKEGGAKGMTSEDVNKFLLARFAPLRNEQIAKINPEMPDSGSGMSTAEARRTMSRYAQSAYATELNAIGRLLDQMSNDKIDGMVADGMITVQEAQKMKAAYPFGYVNLSGQSKENSKFDEAIDPLELAGGRKLNLRGKLQRALGRGEGNEATDILARTVAAYEASIIRGEKNRVAQTVLAMAESNPDPTFYMVNTQAWTRKPGEDGIVREVLDKDYIRRPDVFVAKVRGIPVTIEFMQMGDGTVAQALHGTVYPPEANMVVTFLRTFNNKIGQLITTYNPAWAAVNFMRDVQTMYFNAAADGRITKEMARTMLRDLPKAIRTSLHVAGWPVQPDPNWLEAFNQMKADGGLTGFSMREALEDKVKEIERALAGKDKNFLQKLGDFAEKITLPMEMATRLSAYKTVRDNGFSRTDAAVFSGEITVDFNARGSAQGLRAMYLFFNPAIQGTAKMYQLMRDNPKQVAKYAFALAGMGALTNLLARALGGQGEDGEDKLDQLPTFKRATSIVLYPDMPMGAMPIAYGWNAFFAVGHFGVDWILGKQTLTETAKRIGTTAIEAFLPAGSSGLESQTAIGKIAKGLTPTAGQPILEYLMNENRYGAPIRMSGSTFGGAERPDSEMAFRSVNPISKMIAQGANRVTGDGLTSGTKFLPGMIDFNPAAIDHFVAAYIPGFATEAYKFAGTMVRLARGEEIARTPLPLIDRFSAYPPEGFDAGAFRRLATFVDTRWTAWEKTESAAESDAIKAKYPELGEAKAIVSGTEKLVRKLNSEIAFLDNTTMFPESERVQMMNERKEQLKKVYGEAVKEASKLGKEYREAIRAN